VDAFQVRDQAPFGAVLRRQRLAAGLTQEALAERAHLSAKAVSDLERDPSRRPRLTTVALLADALDLPPDGRAALLAAARPGGDATVEPSAGASRWTLPRPLTPLIGRAGVAAAVAELVQRDATRLLALTGPGGVGKTRVAIEVGRRVTGAFPDGVVFVDLTPLREPALVLRTVGASIAIDDRHATPLHDRVVAALRGKRLLLVLDNFEHLLPAATEVIALLEACPDLTVLVTSRVSLRVRAAREYVIAPLALPAPSDTGEAVARSPAVELFVERALAARANGVTDAHALPVIADICRRLEGLPLALELAAAAARLLSPGSLLARLDRRLAALVGGPRDLPARQQTLRDAIAWSYGLLSESEQAVFRRLCVFAGGCTLEAAETVCGDTSARDSSVLDRLAALVDASLVRVHDRPLAADGADARGQPRLGMLETIREYGVEQLHAHGEHAGARQRHAEHFVTVAQAALAGLSGADAPAATARLDAEHDNVRAALRWVHDRADAPTMVGLAGNLWPFWLRRGHLTEGRQWLQRALDLPGADAVAAPLRLTALIGAARLAIDQADHNAAAAACADAVALAREDDDARRLVAALNVRGHLARQRDRYADSIRDHDEARALAHAHHDQAGEAEALLGLAEAAMITGDPRRARELADDSLTVARATGDDRLVAQAQSTLTWQATNTGDYVRAEALATETLDRWRRLGDTGEAAEAHFLLGNVALFQCEYERADQSFQEALALHRDRGDVLHLSRDLSAVGVTALNLRDIGRAQALVGESLDLARRYDDRWGVAMSLTLLGHVELAAGNDAVAFTLFTEAWEQFQVIGNLIYLPWCLEGLAGVAAAHGNHAGAAELDGARDSVGAHVGVTVPPIHPEGYTRTLTATRTAMTPESFEAARTSGRTRPLNQVIASALGDG
jgi:predicted ATPase/DNA-binding XRE family transcriptional regulator